VTLIKALWWRLVRIGFRLLYNEMAWTYDLVSRVVSLGHWRRWQRASIGHLKVSPSDPILELAHGTGNLQIDLANERLHAVGLDLSPTWVASPEAGWKAAPAGTPGTRKRSQLPFATGHFKAVVSTFPTEFI
jgi:hypothetical protein